jgi:hypothetical protein
LGYDLVAYVYNPGYLAETGRIMVRGQPGVWGGGETTSPWKKAWYCALVIPTMTVSLKY